MKKTTKYSLAVLAIMGALLSAGCSTVERWEAAAVADRAANPAKYQEDPEILRQQLTANEGGAAYPEFCTWGCPSERVELTRAW